jgi:O-antigen/teichoic acid export membrane protein
MGRLAVWLGLANAVQLVLGFALYAVLGRWLGVARLGEIGFAMAVVAIADMAAQGGLSNIITREAAARPKSDGSLFGTALGFKAVFVAIAGAVVAVVAGPWAALLLVGTVGQAGVCILRAKLLKIPLAAANLMPNGFAMLVIAPLAVFFPPSAVLALAAFGSARVAAAAGQLLLTRAHLVRPVSFAMRRGRELLEESWPLWLSEMLIVLFTRTDILLMRWLLPVADADRAIGWYQAARSLSDGGNFILGALVTVSFPMMSAMRGKPPARLQAVLARAMRFGWLAGLAGLAATVVLAYPAIRILFGKAFVPSVNALLIMAPCFPLGVVNGILSTLLIAAGRQKAFLLSAASLVAVNVAGNYFVIPRFTFLGASAMTTAMQAIGLAQLLWLTRDLRRAAPGSRGA